MTKRRGNGEGSIYRKPGGIVAARGGIFGPFTIQLAPNPLSRISTGDLLERRAMRIRQRLFEGPPDDWQATRETGQQ